MSIFETQFSDDSVFKARNYCFKHIIASEDYAFERVHFEDVEKNILKLSKLRQLDETIALIIGYFHDQGRVKNHVYGKAHGKESAKIASRYLKKQKVSEKNISLISNAIKRHGHKSDVHHAYAELIKDADALAHLDELKPSELDAYELYRCDTAYEPMLVVFIQTPSEVLRQLDQAFTTFIALLYKPVYTSSDWIHNLRVSIRKLRTLLWLIRTCFFSNQPKEARHLINEEFRELHIFDQLLKSIFKKLESSRFLYILLKHTFGEVALEKLNDEILFRLNEANEQLQINLDDFISHHTVGVITGQFKKLLKSLENRISSESADALSFFEKQVEKLFDEFIHQFYTVDKKNLNALHKLRINGKKIKYLMAMKILTVNRADFYPLVQTLHDDLGDLHDYMTNLVYLRKEGLASALYKTIAKEKLKILKTNIKLNVFKMKKYSRS